MNKLQLCHYIHLMRSVHGSMGLATGRRHLQHGDGGTFIGGVFAREDVYTENFMRLK